MPVKVDVRLLAATNRNLSDAVKEGRFRTDLYYRLMVVPVDVPPLRERREDIPALAAHFIACLSRQFGRRVEGISEAMMRQLIAYDWPGNIRELENLLSQAIVLSPGGALTMPKFAAVMKALVEHPRSLGEAERRHIESVLASTGWVLEGPQDAATTLNVNPRGNHFCGCSIPHQKEMVSESHRWMIPCLTLHSVFGVSTPLFQ